MRQNSHVVVVGNYPRDGQLSMQKFADVVTSSLRADGYSVDFLRPEVRFSRLAPGSGTAAKWLGYLDKFVVFPRLLRRHLGAIPTDQQAETLVHICDHSNAPYVARLGGLRHLVTCHDMIAVRQSRGEMPGPRVRWTGRRLQQWIVRGLRRADWVACDSHSTRRDLLACTGRAEARSEVIHCQLNHPYARLTEENAWRILAGKVVRQPGTLILHVGNNSWYKNRDGVLRIFAAARKRAPETRLHLVVAGREFTGAQLSFIEREGLTDAVRLISDLSAEELQAAYSVADVFLFPSLYEGFGWPPIEAQACGCPVVAGTGGSLAEILADSALTADARDESRLVDHLVHLLQNPEERLRWRSAGLANVRRFQPPVMMERYFELYDRILDRG